jgi:hypothetical protein
MARTPRAKLSPGLSLADLLLVLLFSRDAPRVARQLRLGVISLLGTVVMSAAVVATREWRPAAGLPAGLASLADSIQNGGLKVVAMSGTVLEDLATNPRQGEQVVLLSVVWFTLLWMFRVLDNGCRPLPMAVERVLSVGACVVLVFCAMAWPLGALGLGGLHAVLGVFHRPATPALWLQQRRWRGHADRINRR